MIDTPFILFLSDVPDAMAAKTAIGILDRRPDRCINSVHFAKDPGRIADHILAQFSS